VFTIFTHRNLMASIDEGDVVPSQEPHWSRARALSVLVLATMGVAIMGELLVESVEHAADTLGMSSVFVGVIVVAIVGNAAEHSTAVLVAMKNKMDLSFTIAVGSGIQIALFVAPLLVFSSMALGHDHPLDLHFTLMEIVAVVISIIVLAQVAQDGQTHWLEGVMLLAVYAVLALAFYHLGEISLPAPAGR
jgi:Ca2+:H+ antiporter